MKKILFFIIAIFILSGCNKIPKKPIFERLSTEELAKAIKSDTLFAEFYESIRSEMDDLSEINKAKYNDITYHRLFNYVKYLNDTIYWNPKIEIWEDEWEDKYNIYLSKADSTINYWKKYLEENSLDKYIKIELANIDKEYYSFINEVSEVNLGFRLTPLQGGIEQLVFTYGYQAKIHEDNKYYEKKRCRTTTPFFSPTIRYWEVDYSDRNIFSGHSVETFLRDYNLYIEVTNIRKNGVNISTDDFLIPEEVSDFLKYGENDLIMHDYYKAEIIKELIDNNFLRKFEYSSLKADELREKKDKLCFEFLNSL